MTEMLQSLSEVRIDKPYLQGRLFGPTQPFLLGTILSGILMAFAMGYSVVQGNTAIILLMLAILPATLALRNPLFGFMLLVALIPIEELTTMGSGATLVRLYGLPVGAIWLLSTMKAKRQIYQPPGFKLLLVLLLWDSMSLLWAFDPGVAGRRLITEVQLFALYLMGVNLVRTKKQAHALMFLFWGAALLGAVFALQALFTQHTRISLTDPTGSGANQFGHLMALCALISVAGTIHYQNRLRWIFFITGFVFVLALFLSLARGTLIALVAAVAALAVFSRRKVITGRWFLLLCAAILLVTGWYITLQFHLLPDEWLNRFSVEEVVDRAIPSRLEYWRVGLEMVKDRPLIGVGLDNFPEVYLDYALRVSGLRFLVAAGRDVHSDYVVRLAELGVVGFLLFVGFLAVVFRTAIRTSKLSTVDRFLWSTSFGMLVVTLVSSIVITYQWRKRYWIVLALVAIVHRLAVEEDSSSRAND